MFTASELMEALRITLFKAGFERLQTAFQKSMVTQDVTNAELEKQVREAFGFQPDEPAPNVTFDPEEGHSFDLNAEIKEAIDEAQSVSEILLQSFLLALMAFWERYLNVLMNVEVYGHPAAMTWLKDHGFKPEEDQLQVLSLYANSLKHGSGRSCRELYPLCPAFFHQGPSATSPSYEPHPIDLKIERSFMENLFEAVRSSGSKPYS